MPTESTNADHAPRLLDLLPDLGSGGLGAAMLRLAHAAAAQHRATFAAQGVAPWTDLQVLDYTSMDKAGHGCPAVSRSAHASGPVTREGDR